MVGRRECCLQTCSHSPGPETLPETSAEGKGKGVIGASCQQLLEVVHPYWGHNGKEVGVHSDHMFVNGVQKLISEGTG